MMIKSLGGKSITLVAALLCTTNMVRAETQRENRLEQRLSLLEEEIARLKAILDRNNAGQIAEGSHHNRTKAVSARPVGAKSYETKESIPRVDANAGSEKPPGAEGEHPQATEGEKPQALQTFRDNAVTVASHQLEVETDLGYQRNSTSLQSDRLIIGGSSIRYGVSDWLELSAQMPYAASFRVTSIGAGSTRSDNLIGLGDGSIQANVQLLKQTSDLPGIVGTIGFDLPTGASPYNLNFYSLDQPGFARTPNPTDVFGNYISRGTWGVHSNLQMYKTIDPVIFFWGAGIDYPFATNVKDYSIRPGTIYNYNFGASLALSEKTTLGLTVLGSYQDFITVNSRVVGFSSSEPILARLSLIERLAESWYLEPSVAFGLTSDAPSIYGDLGVRHRF